MRIYVASSWRNDRQPAVVDTLRAAGHEVYDFRHPEPGNDGFHWSEIDPSWQGWDGAQFASALAHPIAEAGYGRDKAGLDWCDSCVLVLPSGRSAHLEAGYAIGQGKPTAILLDEKQEPELMYKLAATLVHNTDELMAWLGAVGRSTGPGQHLNGRHLEYHQGHRPNSEPDPLVLPLSRSGAKHLREILLYMDNEFANRSFPDWTDRGILAGLIDTASDLRAELNRALEGHIPPAV